MEDKPDKIVHVIFVPGQSFCISPGAWPPKKRLPRKKKKKLNASQSKQLWK